MNGARRRGPALLAAVLAAVLTAAALAGCSSYRDGDRPGVAYPGVGPDHPAHRTVFQLPVGTLTIRTGRPEHEITDATTHHAADGAVIVPVSWQLAPTALQRTDQLTLGDVPLANFPTRPYDIRLVADGRGYDLQAGLADGTTPGVHDPDPVAAQEALTSKQLAVVVQGDGTGLSYEVGYDGLTQTGDVDSGRVTAHAAAGYYRSGGPAQLLGAHGCALLTAADRARYRVASGQRCTVGPVQLLPYVAGLGWVPSAGQSWALVSVDAQAAFGYEPRTGGGRLGASTLDVDLRLDGAAPVATRVPGSADDRDSPGEREAIDVFRVTGTPHQLRARITLHTEDEDTGRRGAFVTDQRYALP